MTLAERNLGYHTAKHLDAWLNVNLRPDEAAQLRTPMLELAWRRLDLLERSWRRIYDLVKA
jgi:hypothetical protein